MNIEVYDVSKERVDLGDHITLPRSWSARVAGEHGVPGTITARVEWDPALSRTAVVSLGVERESEGLEISSRILREVRAHSIMSASALEVVTIDVGEDPTHERMHVHEFLARMQAEQVDTMLAATAIYRVATAASYPPLKLVAETLKVSRSTATRLMSRARDVGLAGNPHARAPRPGSTVSAIK
ncbi:hypothetical protein [Microbacterium lacus]|uniref:Uncharacterized protein n=1 Tax=Microbacterium lacus TaxID=415217 RepID=A0ABN2FY50_9MICO